MVIVAVVVVFSGKLDKLTYETANAGMLANKLVTESNVQISADSELNLSGNGTDRTGAMNGGWQRKIAQWSS